MNGRCTSPIYIDFRCGGLRISGLDFYGMLGELLCPPRGVKRQSVKTYEQAAFYGQGGPDIPALDALQEAFTYNIRGAYICRLSL
jgi:hypothetical protein